MYRERYHDKGFISFHDEEDDIHNSFFTSVNSSHQLPKFTSE
jgi:hypothetical protein